jgi:hypothetical protein
MADCICFARLEGPCSWTFQRAKTPGASKRLTLLGFERDSSGPKGQEGLAQGLPWVFGLSPEALKGRPLTRRPGTTSRNPGGPFRAPHVRMRFPNPGLSSHGPLGRRTDPTRIQGFGKCPNCRALRAKRTQARVCLNCAGPVGRSSA